MAPPIGASQRRPWLGCSDASAVGARTACTRTVTPAKTKPVIVIEDLSVRGLIRNGHLSWPIAHAGWSAFRRMLAYRT